MTKMMIPMTKMTIMTNMLMIDDGKDDHDDDRHEKGCLPRGSIGDQR